MNTPKPNTLLASLAITTLLLTACGSTQQVADLPKPENSSSSTAGPTATSMAASAATTDPDPASTSPSQAYSSGSKAPEGEYRAADEHGPAQTVPKPVAPAGMNVESPEALFLFIDYWNELRNYAIQTGDIDSVQQLVADTWESENNFYNSLVEVYKSGGWVVGGTREIILNHDLLLSHGNGVYSIVANFDVKDSVLWYRGESTYKDSKDFVFNSIEIRLMFNQQLSRWTVEVAEVDK